jgi:hypothetical protein
MKQGAQEWLLNMLLEEYDFAAFSGILMVDAEMQSA